MGVRAAFACIGLNIANYMAVAVNERTGGFVSPRRRVIGLVWTIVMLLTFPLNACTSYKSPLLVAASILGMADFGNCRELSLRWMLYSAEETGPLRWMQAIGKHIHHSGVLSILAFILSSGIDAELRPIADKALFVDYVVAFSHLCVMLRFERVAKWVMYIPGLLAPVAAIGFAAPVVLGSITSREELCFRALIGFSFTGT